MLGQEIDIIESCAIAHSVNNLFNLVRINYWLVYPAKYNHNLTKNEGGILKELNVKISD